MRARSLTAVALFAALLTATGHQVADGLSYSTANPVRGASQYSVEAFLEVTSLVGNSFSPSTDKILVSSDEGGVFNAYSVSTEDGSFHQLTYSTDNAIKVEGYFPRDERFLFLSNEGGDELDHLYVREPSGRTTDLTPGHGHTAKFVRWAHDGNSLFVATNGRDKRYFDLYEVGADSYEQALVFRNEEGYEFLDVSPGKGYVVLGKTQTRSDSDIWLYDLKTQGTRLLTPSEGEIEHRYQAFSPDDGSIYYTTNEGGEFAYLMRLDLVTGGRRKVIQPPWDVTFAVLSHNGAYLVVGVNKDAQTDIQVFDVKTLERLTVARMPEGDISSVTLSRDETRMAFYGSTSRSPPNLYVYDFSDKEPRRLTHTLPPGINEGDLVEGQSVRFRSFDGLEIPGLLYQPHRASLEAKVPALVWVHGGPGEQFRVGYKALVQYLVNQGYAIYAINNRGSTGYGKSFFKADDRGHGRVDLDDCVASKGMLAEAGYIDTRRVGIIGSSYGGYMVLAALSFRPEAFAVGVDLFGVSNWIRTLENMPPWWEHLRGALLSEIGDPQRDRSYLQSISPLFHAGNIVKPLLVLQGGNDPRVQRSESDDIVSAVRVNGVPHEYIVFDDEGHSIEKKENRLVAFGAIRRFLDKHLKGEPGTTAADPSAGTTR